MKPDQLVHGPLSTQTRCEQGKSLLAALAGHAKEVISQQGVGEVQRHAFRIGKTLRLTGENGEWTGPPDPMIPDPLFAGSFSNETIYQFIDEIAYANEQNNYLLEFAGSLTEQPFSEVSDEMRRSSARLIPEIVAFALVLQNLTAAFYLDIDLVNTLVTHWDQEAEKIGLHKKLGPGFRIKFESIRAPIQRSRECVLAANVPERFCNFILPSNIIQASVYDLARGHFGNARAGLVLARHRPGNSPDPATGAGPVHFVKNGRVIESGLPLAQNWADLYQTWNLAFGAQFNTFPFYLCKLIIPQVAGFQAYPQQYVWNRTHALMAYLYFAAFAAYDHAQGNLNVSLFYANEWPAMSGSGLQRRWGDINHASARDYAHRVRAARNR